MMIIYIDDWLVAITGFDWDGGNPRKSVKKHQVTQHEAEQLFFNQPLLILEDTKHSQQGMRFHTLGKSDAGRELHVTFTLRSDKTLIRVISTRNMYRKERKLYEQARTDS